MQNILKFSALAAVCSVAAYGLALAQGSASARSRTQGDGVASGRPIAQMGGAPKLSAFQQALHMHVVNLGNANLDKTQDPGTREKIIIAQNVLVMACLSPEQQKENLKWIQLEQYRPGAGPWDRVRNAKSMVKALLVISPEQQKVISAFYAMVQAERAKENEDLLKLPREEGLRKQQERQARKSKAEHNADWAAMLRRQENMLMKLMTPEQKREWDAVVALGDREYQNAFAP